MATSKSPGTSKSKGKSASKAAGSSAKSGSGRSNGATRSTAGKLAATSSAASAGQQKAAPKKRAAGNGRSESTANKATPKKGPNGIVSTVIEKVSSLFKGGKPDAIDLLKIDHRRVDGLFAKVKANEDGNNRPIFRKIKVEMDTHAHIEETIFYPYVQERGNKQLKKIVFEGIEEHRQVKMFLGELDGLQGTSDAFKAKLKVLMEDVEHHVKEEEDEMFPLVRDQIGDEALRKLALRLQTAKDKFKIKAAKKAPARSRSKASAAA